MNTTNSDNMIDELIKDNKIQRFASELQNTTDEKRKADIKSILHMLEGLGITKDTQDARSRLDVIYQKIDECALQKKWNRLEISQRLNRLTKYLKEIIPDAKKRTPIETKLTAIIKDGGMATVKYVTYDPFTSQILAIANLVKNDETNEYELVGAKKSKPAKKKEVSDSDSE